MKKHLGSLGNLLLLFCFISFRSVYSQPCGTVPFILPADGKMDLSWFHIHFVWLELARLFYRKLLHLWSVGWRLRCGLLLRHKMRLRPFQQMFAFVSKVGFSCWTYQSQTLKWKQVPRISRTKIKIIEVFNPFNSWQKPDPLLLQICSDWPKFDKTQRNIQFQLILHSQDQL